MIRTLSRLGALALLLPLAACDSTTDDDGGSFDVTAYTGTYTGAATTTFTTPDTTLTTTTALGVAIAAPAGGNAVTITMTPTGGTPVVFSGTYDANGAVFPVPNSTLVMRVDSDGDISGDGTLPFFDVTLDAETSGRITRERFLLTADVRVTEGNDEVPDGATGRIEFEALRSSSGT